MTSIPTRLLDADRPLMTRTKLTSKPRLLIVGAFPPAEKKIYGGIATACRLLINSSLRDTFDLVLVDSTQRGNPAPRLPIRCVLAVRRFVLFCTHLLFDRPDAVMLFCSAGASVLEKGAMARIAQALRLPVLIFPRGGRLIDHVAHSRLKRILTLSALRCCDIFLCQGPAWHKFATEVVGFSPASAPIVPNWTATEELLRIGEVRTYENRCGPLRLLFLGCVEKEKGIFELLEACSLLPTADYHLVIAGCGRGESNARDFVRRTNLTSSVSFKGWLEGEELHDMLRSSDVLVLPSWSEGLPNAMIESMAAGLVVVVSRVGNIPDFIAHEKEGILVDPLNIEELHKALCKLINADGHRAALAERGHTYARRTFSISSAVHKLREAVFKVIDDKR